MKANISRLILVSFFIFAQTFNEICMDEIRVIDIKMFCYEYALAFGKYRNHFPSNIEKEMMGAVSSVIKNSPKDATSGLVETFNSQRGNDNFRGCKLSWKRSEDELNFEAFGYDVGDISPDFKSPSKEDFETNNSKYISKYLRAEKNSLKNGTCENEVLKNKNYVGYINNQRNHPISKLETSKIESVLNYINKNVHPTILINPTIFDRRDATRDRILNSNRRAYLQFEVNTYPSYDSWEEEEVVYPHLSKEEQNKYKDKGPDYFESMFGPAKDNDLSTLSKLEYYQFEGFREYIKKIPEYESFIIALKDAYHTKSDVKETIINTQGFKTGFLAKYGIGKTKSEFKEWIFKEVERIYENRFRKEVEQEEKIKSEIEKEQLEELEEQKFCEKFIKNIKKKSDWIRNYKYQESIENRDQEAFELSEESISEGKEINDLEDFFEGKKKEKKLKPHLKNCVDLGSSFLDDVIESFELKSLKNFKRNKDRASAIAEYLQDPDKTFELEYSLRPPMVKMLKKGLGRYIPDYGSGIALTSQDQLIKDYSTCDGDSIQCNITRELFHTLDEAADIYDAFYNDSSVVNFIKLINLSAETAHLHKMEKEYEQAYALSDYCDGLLDVTKKFTELVANGVWGLYKSAEIITKGVALGFKPSLEFLHQCVTNPIGAALDYYMCLGRLALLGGRVALLACTDLRGLINKIKNLASTAYSFAMEYPEEAAVNTIATITDLVLVRKFKNKMLNKAGEIKPIADAMNIIKDEVKNVKTALTSSVKSIIDNPNAQKIIAPIQSAANQTQEILKIATVHGVDATKRAINGIKNHRFVTSVNKTIERMTSTGKLHKKAKVRDLLHMDDGEIFLKNDGSRSFGLYAGMHTKNAFENFVSKCNVDLKDLIISELPNGVKRIQIPKKYFHTTRRWELAYVKIKNGTSIRGAKTLWPEGYTLERIVKEAKEIVKNPANKMPDGYYIGMTSDGIRAVVYADLKRDSIRSYPCWEQ